MSQTLGEIADQAQDEEFDPRVVTVNAIRQWPTEKLYLVLHGHPVTEVVKGMIRTEIETREQWRRPGAFSVVIALMSLIVATIAMAMSIWR